MTQTITRELKLKFKNLLNAESLFTRYATDDDSRAELQEYQDAFADKLVAAALEVRGIAKSQLPPGSSLDWSILAGQSSEQIVAEEEAFAAEKRVLDAYERAMGYGVLPWYSDPKLEKLRRFISAKTVEEINTFAIWCNRQYSKFRPEDARRYPEQVWEFWPMAFKKDEPKSQSPKSEGFYA